MFQRRKRFDNPLAQYWHVLWKRWKSVLLAVLVFVLAGVIYNLSRTPLYRSEAKILIEDPSRWVGVQDGTRLTMDWYLTQFRILTSRPILVKVAEKLDLANQYWSSPTPLETLRSRLLRRPIPQSAGSATAESVGPRLQGAISIAPETTTGLVSVAVVASKGAIARDITNALIETFVEENLQASLKMSFAANDYLSRQLQKISSNIREAERALEDYEKQEGIPSLPTAIPIERQQLSEFVSKLAETKTLRWELAEKVRILEQAADSRDYSALNSEQLLGTEVSASSKELFEAELKLGKLVDQGYLDKHPEVVKTRDEIETLKKRLAFTVKSSLAGFRAELSAAEQREKALESTIQQFHQPASEASRRHAQHEYLRREVEIQKGFYASYNEQLKRLELSSESRSTNVRIIEPASLPGGPFSPNRSFNLTLALIAGLFVGVFLAYFREYLDDTIKSSEDVQEYLEMPVLGTIPIIGEGSDRQPTLTRKLDSGSLVSEAYRTLRTNLQFFESERSLQVLLVTSAAPSEGKSTTVANIALTLVQMGKRVCIVDTDLRKPVLHKLFSKPNRFGVTSIFAGITDKRRLLMPTGYENLYLLPCGPIPPNPAELLASPRMEEAVRNLRKDFDYVLFDSPPVLAVTDALVLSALVDGVLLVIKSGEAKIRTCQIALDSLMSIKANVVGVVLNHFNYRQAGYHSYYYSKYYREGYGYVYGGGAKERATEEPAAETADRAKS